MVWFGREHHAPFMNSNGKDSGRFKGSERECDGRRIRNGSKIRCNLLNCKDAFPQGFEWFVNVDDRRQGLAIGFSIFRRHSSICGQEVCPHGQRKDIAESPGRVGKDSQKLLVNGLDDLAQIATEAESLIGCCGVR